MVGGYDMVLLIPWQHVPWGLQGWSCSSQDSKVIKLNTCELRALNHAEMRAFDIYAGSKKFKNCPGVRTSCIFLWSVRHPVFALQPCTSLLIAELSDNFSNVKSCTFFQVHALLHLPQFHIFLRSCRRKMFHTLSGNKNVLWKKPTIT